jgi:hypothetical protein
MATRADKNIRPGHLISVLLPTRGRTDALKKSIQSLVNHCADINAMEVIMAFDEDDTVGQEYFSHTMRPWLEKKSIDYTALLFSPMGYEHLNIYYNKLAENSDGSWLFAWNDDAIMETQDWDLIIKEKSNQFRLFRVQTHQSHPYSIFPIWPRAWYDVFGFASRHQMIDAELSQNAYCLDLLENINIQVTHDRFDLTGNNLDDTQKKKRTLEGNPADPRDFHNPAQTLTWINDCQKLAEYLESRGHDMSYWKDVRAGKIDPWAKLRANDPNKLTFVKSVAIKKST